MSAVGEFDDVSTRREYVVGLFTEYVEGALGPELRFTVENALDSDPILASFFESYERTIIVVHETLRSRPITGSQVSTVVTFLRDTIRTT